MKCTQTWIKLETDEEIDCQNEAIEGRFLCEKCLGSLSKLIRMVGEENTEEEKCISVDSALEKFKSGKISMNDWDEIYSLFESGDIEDITKDGDNIEVTRFKFKCGDMFDCKPVMTDELYIDVVKVEDERVNG